MEETTAPQDQSLTDSEQRGQASYRKGLAYRSAQLWKLFLLYFLMALLVWTFLEVALVSYTIRADPLYGQYWYMLLSVALLGVALAGVFVLFWHRFIVCYETLEQERLSLEKELSQQTHLSSITDQLTDLYNLQYFGIRLEEELNRAWRYNHSLSLLLVDFDDFSAVNERYGRFVGDEVLRRFARFCLLGILRTTDMAARYGGDEFAVLLTGTDAQGAVRITQRIQELVQQGIPLSAGKFLNIGVSIGVATFPNDGATRKGLLQLAEARLNEAKRGKGRRRPSSRSFPWPRDIFQSERVSM